MKKKISDLYCKNSSCRTFLCSTDGEFLIIENLEILPKFKVTAGPVERKIVFLICPICEEKLKFYPRKRKDAASNETKSEKFSIFRSRF